MVSGAGSEEWALGLCGSGFWPVTLTEEYEECPAFGS